MPTGWICATPTQHVTGDNNSQYRITWIEWKLIIRNINDILFRTQVLKRCMMKQSLHTFFFFFLKMRLHTFVQFKQNIEKKK